MATQGLLTITQQGQVAMKIITGQDGMNMPELVREMKKKIQSLGRIPTADEAYDLALQVGFGAENSLVVMDKKKTTHRTDGPIHRRYRRTFNRPQFNPRWDLGIADFTKVIEI